MALSADLYKSSMFNSDRQNAALLTLPDPLCVSHETWQRQNRYYD
jgi:hypothetical protein